MGVKSQEGLVGATEQGQKGVHEGAVSSKLPSWAAVSWSSRSVVTAGGCFGLVKSPDTSDLLE